MKKILKKIKALFKWVWNQLKDWRNLVIFIVVFLFFSGGIWVPAIIGFITRNAWWYGIAAACWAFWLAPFTPFFPLCIAVTFAIRKLIDKFKRK